MKPKSLAGHKKVSPGHVSEARVVEKLGFRPTAASGATQGCKSDGYNDKYRLECKSTKYKSMTLEASWLHKVAHEALETGRLPLLTISFTTPQGRATADGDWVLMPLDDFIDLTQGDQ